MRVALDTNVIVRFLVVDDEPQALAARALLHTADQILISTLVLCETVWVLSRAYRYPAASLADALRQLTDIQGVEIDRPIFEAGLAMLERGGDFADGCILFEAGRAKCDRLATFDAGLIALSQGRASLP
ncbi:MAG: hypothetical protein B7Z44_11475 [Caulobacter sp. 12-67-6]|nr:MAG: hypothetical protein B7Z44_11475 [Caulobacter sp. 12-67-6]OYX73000.1 MAG: hypothetical protein B7Y81_04635 [Caulobacter sp. 32-67-35]OYX97105.1 MAG: hypothetical protein B7Y78_02455 [Caulobacter sp. 35-67-4]OZA77400.1 MAG: hypothetical protein B7X77_04740 [Caulobacter sp. 39-67-4]HQR88187.1 type II toxin-antitoxin system VapC family toxin [Caulobacter sp.]